MYNNVKYIQFLKLCENILLLLYQKREKSFNIEEVTVTLEYVPQTLDFLSSFCLIFNHYITVLLLNQKFKGTNLERCT